MPDFKVGDKVKRVRNSNGSPEAALNIKIGTEFIVRHDLQNINGLLCSDTGYALADDCELVAPAACPSCGQPLPEPETITVPEHTLPWHLTVEPDNGAVVWTISAYGANSFPYSLHSGNINFSRRLFNAGLLYATEAEAQARYEAIVAPTRREEEQ